MYQENLFKPVGPSRNVCDQPFNGTFPSDSLPIPPKRILARNIDYDYFARHMNKLSDFYCEIFNSADSVDAIGPAWTRTRAAEFLAARLRRLGVNIALLHDSQLIGLYLNLIVPKATGIALVEGELALHPDVRINRLGTELVHLSKKCAEHICRYSFGEDPVVDETTTYRRPAFPKQWWLRVGYHPAPRYEVNLTALPGHQRPRGVKVHAATKGPLPTIAAFMCKSQSFDLGASRWSFGRAEAYLEFMFRQNPSLIRIAATEDEIVGLIVADLIPRRCGVYLGQTLVVVRPNVTTDVDEICQGLMIDLAQAGSRLSEKIYGVSPLGIEMTAPLGDALRGRLSAINEDQELIDMTIDHDLLMSALRPRQPPRFQLVEPVEPRAVTSGRSLRRRHH
jgi:hypothetical protein